MRSIAFIDVVRAPKVGCAEILRSAEAFRESVSMRIADETVSGNVRPNAAAPDCARKVSGQPHFYECGSENGRPHVSFQHGGRARLADQAALLPNTFRANISDWVVCVYGVAIEPGNCMGDARFLSARHITPL